MKTPYSSSFLRISSPTTLFFLPSLKSMYYEQFDKSIEERNISDFNKTQSLICETLSRPLYAILVHFAENINTLLPDSQPITHQIAKDVEFANLVRYSSFNTNLKDFAASVNNAFSPNPAQIHKFVKARNISHSAVIELVLKLCSCISNKQMQSSKFSTPAHYAVKNIFELLAVEDMFDAYSENKCVLDDDVLKCRKYIASFFKNFNVDDYLNYRPILAHEFYDALIDVCASKLPKNSFKQNGIDKLLNKLNPKYVIPDVVMKAVEQHLDLLSRAFFITTAHTYLECKNMSPMELKLNRVIACTDYEFSDLIHICSEDMQCKIINENYLLEYQIKRQDSHIELLRLNTCNLIHRELTNEELAHERLEYIISNFPLRYHEALNDILDIIYDKFASSEFFAMLVKKFDRISTSHEQQPMYSMHHNVVHCEFELCKNYCEERSYSVDCNEQHKSDNAHVNVEPKILENLDEFLKFCDTQKEQICKDANDIDKDNKSNSKFNCELDSMSKFMLELVGMKLKTKPKEYINDLLSEIKLMFENKIDINKWLNDETIPMEKKLEVGYIIKKFIESVKT